MAGPKKQSGQTGSATQWVVIGIIGLVLTICFVIYVVSRYNSPSVGPRPMRTTADAARSKDSLGVSMLSPETDRSRGMSTAAEEFFVDGLPPTEAIVDTDETFKVAFTFRIKDSVVAGDSGAGGVQGAKNIFLISGGGTDYNDVLSEMGNRRYSREIQDCIAGAWLVKAVGHATVEALKLVVIVGGSDRRTNASKAPSATADQEDDSVCAAHPIPCVSRSTPMTFLHNSIRWLSIQRWIRPSSRSNHKTATLKPRSSRRGDVT